MFKANANKSLNTLRFTCQHNLRCHNKILKDLPEANPKLVMQGMQTFQILLRQVAVRKVLSHQTESDSPTNCISCKKQFSSLSDEMFQCELCPDNWICISCMGISPELYVFLSQRQDLPWFCPECNGKVKKMIDIEKHIETTCHDYLQKYQVRVENLETCMETKADKAVLDDTEARVTSCEGQL